MQLSPLAVLIAVLIGAELAGVIGALAAIPVAGAIQVILRRLARTVAAGGAGARRPPPSRRLPHSPSIG